MPSGIEEAGVVLAILPLVISMIDSYGRGLRCLTRAFKHKKNLRSIRRELATELQLFEDAVCKLLNLVFEDGGSIARSFAHKPLETRWQDPDLEAQAVKVLGERLWTTYKEHILQIQEVLGRLLKDLWTDLPERQSETSKHAAAIIQRLRIAFDRPTPRFDTLRRLMDSFQRLVDNAEARPKPADQEFDFSRIETLRDSASQLCAAIEHNLDCEHHVEHVINFQLCDPVYSIGNPKRKETRPIVPLAKERFEVLLQHEPDKSRRLIEFRPQATNKTCNACQHVKELCFGLRQDDGVARKGCLGYICERFDANDRKERYCICPGVILETQLQLTSLYEVLSSSRSSQLDIRPPFFFEAIRFKLAIVLAISILGLHSTPWLPPVCTTQDILFLSDKNQLDEYGALRPYVARSFPHQTSKRISAAPRMVRNAQMYALGKLLIQLVECRPLLDTSSIESTALEDPHHDPEEQKALELEVTMAGKVGRTWSQVIRRCLYCEFDVDSSVASLDNELFVAKVYSLVIQPLIAGLESISS